MWAKADNTEGGVQHMWICAMQQCSSKCQKLSASCANKLHSLSPMLNKFPTILQSLPNEKIHQTLNYSSRSTTESISLADASLPVGKRHT